MRRNVARYLTSLLTESDHPPPETPLGPGFRLDRYELVCPIAEGGMASVWVARLVGKHGFEKLVAIKTILPKFASDARFQTMFLDEARIASGIDHTNVAKILDLGEEHNVLYLVMEYVDGEALSKLQRFLARRGIPMPHGIILRIMADASAGLHAAHELQDRDGGTVGVVHRDVSPQNILINTQGVAKIIDFGIAKVLDGSPAETSSGVLKGKIQYMAPEQALGQVLDRRADVWAVGAVLYNFFAGRPVFDADSQLAALQLLTSGTEPAPLPATVPEPIAEVIMGALKHDLDERWATAAVLQHRLEKAMASLGCQTSTSEVAAFLKKHIAERTASKKQAIERAIATLRERPDQVPLPPSSHAPSIPSSSGLVTRARPSSSDSSSADASRLITDGATLGSAAIEAPATRPPRKSRWTVVASVIVAVAVVSIGGAGLRYKRRGSGRALAASAAARQPTVSAAATPSPSVAPSMAIAPSLALPSRPADAGAAPSGSVAPSSQRPPVSRSRAAPSRPGPAPPPSKHVIDDGF